MAQPEYAHACLGEAAKLEKTNFYSGRKNKHLWKIKKMSFNIKTEVNWEEETCLAANWEQCGFLFDRMISIDEITGLTLGLKFAVRLSIDEGRDPIFEIKPMPGIEVLNGVDIQFILIQFKYSSATGNGCVSFTPSLRAMKNIKNGWSNKNSSFGYVEIISYLSIFHLKPICFLNNVEKNM